MNLAGQLSFWRRIVFGLYLLFSARPLRVEATNVDSLQKRDRMKRREQKAEPTHSFRQEPTCKWIKIGAKALEQDLTVYQN